MKDSLYLSIVIPAYNEIRNLKRGVLEDVYSYLKTQDFSWEIILVDDGSDDSTLSYLRDFSKQKKYVRVLAEPHRGKAGTVISGMLSAKGDIVLFTDLDQATPINQLEKFLPEFEHGYDIVIGSRHGRKGAPIVRKVMALGFVVLRFLLLQLPYRDTQCGFKGFKHSVVTPIFERLKVFRENQSVTGSAVTAGFDLELLYVARKLGYKVAEVPVEWEEKGDRGKSGVNPLKDSWEGLRDLLRVRMNALLGKYT
jgi:glycosyltransferase involved in cell wall biosynthesis